MSGYDTYLKTAVLAADKVREISMAYWRSELIVDYKSDDSPVSRADSESEQLARQLILHHHPDHAIIGEEFEPHGNADEWVWFIDPIDGTKAFVSGGYYWGFMLALWHNGEFVLGLIDLPAINERYIGQKGMQTTLNGQIVHTSNIASLNDARVYTTLPDTFTGKSSKVLNRLREGAAIFAYGGDCYLSAALARGHIDTVIECGLCIHDIAAAVPIIEGAGGTIRNWDDTPITPANCSNVLICANTKLYNDIRGVIN